MKLNKLITTIALSALLTAPVFAKTENLDVQKNKQTKIEKSVQKDINNKVQDIAKGKRDTLEDDALTALNKTAEALKAMDDKDADKALKLVEESIGKLEVVISANPEMVNAPVATNIVAYDAIIDLPTILASQKIATHYLVDGEIQQARKILEPLRSEMIVSTTSLPLKAYVETMKSIVPQIKDGKTKEAKQALQTVLGTLVVEDEVIPLPLLKAEMILGIAKVKALVKRSKDAQKELDELIDSAVYQLAIAEGLGYGDTLQYAEYAVEIAKIKDEVKNRKASKGFFDKIIDSLTGANDKPETKKKD